MQDLAAIIGRFVGSAINPVVWIVVAVALYMTRGLSGWMRVTMSVVATVALGALLYMTDEYFVIESKLTELFFAALVALVISSTWVLIRKRNYEEPPDDED